MLGELPLERVEVCVLADQFAFEVQKLVSGLLQLAVFVDVLGFRILQQFRDFALEVFAFEVGVLLKRGELLCRQG